MNFLPHLYDFLAEKGYIYTVRGYLYREGTTISGDYEVKRTLVKKIERMEELREYVVDSGFSCLNAWWIKIVQLAPNSQQRWLYKVELI